MGNEEEIRRRIPLSQITTSEVKLYSSTSLASRSLKKSSLKHDILHSQRPIPLVKAIQLTPRYGS